MAVYTVGHGNRSASEFASLLHAAGAGTLCDVRRWPASRRNAHFGRDALEKLLSEAGIVYEWWGEDLGGRRSRPKNAPSRHGAWRNEAFRAYADHMDSEGFRSALARLERRASGATTLAIMCAEVLWWRCHRRLISDALWLHGFEVVHLTGMDAEQAHRPHPALRADAEGRPVYDVGVTPELWGTDGQTST